MRLRNIYIEMSIRRTVNCKNKEQRQNNSNIGDYIIKYKEKWEKTVRKNDNDAEINSDEYQLARVVTGYVKIK
jgi:hypothetical protein